MSVKRRTLGIRRTMRPDERDDEPCDEWCPPVDKARKASILWASDGVRRVLLASVRSSSEGMGTKQSEGDAWCAPGGLGRLAVRGRGAGVMGIVALAMLVLLLAGCDSGARGGPAPVATFNGGTPGPHATLTLPTLTVSASPSSATGQQGVNEFCSKSPDVSIHPGGNVPVYPGASLNFSQASNNNAFFGFCTAAASSDVQTFYTQHLPQSGWSGVQTSTIASVVQLTATQCAKDTSPKIIVTISPDTTGATTTSISIVVLGGSC